MKNLEFLQFLKQSIHFCKQYFSPVFQIGKTVLDTLVLLCFLRKTVVWLLPLQTLIFAGKFYGKKLFIFPFDSIWLMVSLNFHWSTRPIIMMMMMIPIMLLNQSGPFNNWWSICSQANRGRLCLVESETFSKLSFEGDEERTQRKLGKKSQTTNNRLSELIELEAEKMETIDATRTWQKFSVARVEK